MQSPRNSLPLIPKEACINTTMEFLQHLQYSRGQLQNLPHTCVYLDDILITGKTAHTELGRSVNPSREGRTMTKEVT